ncbi:hypothetical protein AGMMS49938_05350 [Fibrobacterales bacterium]|nr:hypothetical protein AGMMS49938_05350 [Fibrobacterales bacterium]
MPASPKYLADLLRNFLLRIGKDWKRASAEYDNSVKMRADFKPEYLIGDSTMHKRILDLYLHWRTEAGLGAERDMFSGSEEGDSETPLFPPLPRAVLIHNLRSAYNVGSIFRTSDCFGIAEINLSGYTPSIEHPALKSAARGSEQWLKSCRWESPLDCISHYKELEYSVIALETGGINLNDFAFPQKILFIVGNEELGIASELIEKCDHKISIQMHGRKASLNVSCAFAVLAAYSNAD